MDNDVYKILQQWHELYKSGAITEAEFIKKKKELLGNPRESLKDEKSAPREKAEDTSTVPDTKPSHEEKSEVADIQYPRQEVREETRSSLWLKKNRVLFIILPAFIVLFIIVYILFLRPNPAADGKKAADAFCNCTVRYDSAMIVAANLFINSFRTYNFRTRQAAEDQWQQIQNPINNEYANCKNAAQDLEGRLSSKYNSNNNQYNTFQAALSSENGSCDMQNQSELASLSSDVQNKIAGVVMPIPNVNQIANDLVSRGVQAWPGSTLQQLEPPDQWIIKKVNKTNDFVDFTIDLEFIGAPLDDHHSRNIMPTEILVGYEMESRGWQFNYDKILKITVTYYIPADYWIEVFLGNITNLSINSRGNRYWVEDGSRRTFKGGPDVPSLNLNTYNMYFRSREDTGFNMDITYTPSN